MIVLEDGIAFSVTPDEFRILLEDRANGRCDPVDLYGFEVGAFACDLAALSPDLAREVLRAMDAKMGGQPAVAPVALGDIDAVADRVAAEVAEEGIFFPLPDAIKAA